MKKVIWAVDVLQSELNWVRRPLNFLTRLGLKPFPEVEMVYLLSTDLLNLTEGTEIAYLHSLQPGAEKAMQNLMERLRLDRFFKGKVLVHQKHSLSASAHALVDLAKFEGADFILLSSHSRRGLKRVMLGSFAETVVQVSEVPVVVVGGHATQGLFNRSILFATDFTPESQPALQKVKDLAKKTGARIRLFYAIPNRIEPVFQAGALLFGGVWIPMRTHLKEAKTRIQVQANAWLNDCQAEGLKCDIKIVPARNSVAEEILRESRRKPPLFIAMATRQSAVRAFFTGSIAREVLRAASVPVWLVRNR